MDRDERVRDLLAQTQAGRLDRRQFIGRLAALGLAPGAVAALVAACGGGNQTTPEAAATTTATVGGATTETGAAAAETSAIPGPPWEGGTRGGTGRTAFRQDTIDWDPPLAYDLAGYYGVANFCRGLLFHNEKAEPGLDLAESMDVSDDAKSYLFKIKPGVTFHNGRELAADDFKWTWERATSKETASWVQSFLTSVEGHPEFVAGSAKDVSGIKVVDDHTIELTLHQPDVTIPGVLGIVPFFALPSTEAMEQGKDFGFTLGTGPFMMDNLDLTNRHYTAKRFENYVYGDKLPYFDEISWEWGVPQQLQYFRVKRDELEAMGDEVLAAQALQLAKANTGEDEFKSWDTLSIRWVEFNVKKPPFDNVKVRQAFNYAFNRERVQRLAINPTGHFLPTSLLGYDEGLQTYEYDPERAKSLLAEAGYADGLELTMPVFEDDQVVEQVDQLLQQDLKAIGVNVSLQRDPATVYQLGFKVAEKYPLWVMGWGMGLPDPLEIYNSLVGTKATSNYGGYSNPRVDELGTQGQAEVDRTRRGEIYAEMEKTMVEDAAFIFIGLSTRPEYKRKELQNYLWEPVNVTCWDRFWLSA